MRNGIVNLTPEEAKLAPQTLLFGSWTAVAGVLVATIEFYLRRLTVAKREIWGTFWGTVSFRLFRLCHFAK
jgi:hypothetical protein